MSAPSVLEYARSHGLAADHTTGNFLQEISHSPLALTGNDTELPDPDFSLFAHELSEPKLQLSHQGGALLFESIRDPRPVINWSNFLPEPHRVRKLKIEEPLLAGDHDTDVHRVIREASGHMGSEQLLETCSLISSTADEDFDDEWNDIQSGDTFRSVERDLEDERCHTTKESLVYLSTTLRNKFMGNTKDEILNTALPPIKRLRARSLTPLLMPEEESPEPYVPSSPDLDFELRSEENVDLDNLLLQIEREMQERDQILSDRASDISPTNAKQLLQEARSGPEVKLEKDLGMKIISPSYAERRQARTELEGFKHDAPLLSSSSLLERMSENTTINSEPNQNESSSTKPQAFHVNTSAQLVSCGPDNRNHTGQTSLAHTVEGGYPMSLDDLFPSKTIKAEDDDFDDMLDEDLTEELFRLTESAKDEIDAMPKQDKVVAAEGCLKHPVPQFNESLINPPWDSKHDEFLACKLGEMGLIPSDPADLRKEMQLNWESFPPRFMKLGLEDDIEDDGKLHKIVEPPQAITKSEQMLYKRPGLRLLDTGDESDAEIEEDLELLKEMSNPVMPIIPAKRLEDGLDSTFKLPLKKSCMAHDEDVQDILEAKSSFTNSSNSFPTSNPLETFLDLRGGKFKRVELPQPVSANELVDDPIQPTQFEESNSVGLSRMPACELFQPRVNSKPETVQVPSTSMETACEATDEDLHQVIELEWSKTVLMETAILQRYCSLANFLETFGGDRLNIVYREMSKSNHDNGVSASPDMILNPRTGLIFTNLQALNQKSLPGQGAAAGQSMIQSRVARLAQEYDQLFILITTPSSNGTLFQAQVDAMTTFTGFCASLRSDDALVVTPIWVTSKTNPRAIDEALNRWVWNLVCQYAFPESDPSRSPRQVKDTVALINEETLWERFLRRTGLNPMAAQTIIGSLRRLDPSEGGLNQSWGLRRLVQLRPYERTDMFTEILGLRLIERLNGVLDKDWR